MSEKVSSLDELIAKSQGDGSSIFPDDPFGDATEQAPTVTAPLPATGAQGSPPQENQNERPKRARKTTKKAAPVPEPPSDNTIPDPELELHPTHLSTVGGDGKSPLAAQDVCWVEPEHGSQGTTPPTAGPTSPSITTAPVAHDTNDPTDGGKLSFVEMLNKAASHAKPKSANSIPDSIEKAMEAHLLAESGDSAATVTTPVTGEAEPTHQELPVTPASTTAPPSPPASVSPQSKPAGSYLDVVLDARDEVQALHMLREATRQRIEQVDRETGIVAYRQRDTWDARNLVHESVHFARWEPQKLFTWPPDKLCQLEPVLAAAQATVQTTENWWKAEFDQLGEELDRIMFVKRERYPGATKTEKENNCLAQDREMRRLRTEYLIAKSIRTYLDGMGKSFEILAYSVKKTIDYRLEEQRMAARGARHTP